MNALLRLIAPIAITASAVFAPSAQAQDAVTFRLNWYLSGWMAPFYYGIQEGYYKDVGIDVTISEGRGSGVAVQIVGAKQETFGFADVSTLILAVAKDVPVKSVASILNVNDAGIISLEGSGIKTAADLKGKRIAITAGDSATATFPAVLAANNISRDDITLIQVDAAAKPVMVMEKQADALLGGLSDQPFLIQEKGFKTEAVTFAELGVSLVGFAVIAHNDLIEENPDLVRRFVAATSRSWEAARDNPESVMSSLHAVKPDFDLERGLKQLKIMLELMDTPNTEGKPAGYHGEADWAALLELLKQYRDLQTDLPTTAFFTNEFVPAQ
ncbi:MAG: ABC transporter substrate-binding protein [Rhizobiales bacterium]|nr:ABC transporter substrate-binding protein [Hyphomicrobiales bacterium]MDQ3558816.1 ABC transporter substrate-binding protein [Pseudomonadota bacterium]